MAYFRVHVVKKGQDTTISLSRTVAYLLSLHLVDRIDHLAVRDWCQAQINRDPGEFLQNTSQRLEHHAVLAIVPAKLREAYDDKILSVKTTVAEMKRLKRRS